MSWWETLHLVTWWKRLGISAIKTGQDAPSWIWCTERLSFFGGGHIVLQRFVHVRCHFQPLPTKLVFAYFDRGSYIWLYMCISFFSFWKQSIYSRTKVLILYTWTGKRFLAGHLPSGWVSRNMRFAQPHTAENKSRHFCFHVHPPSNFNKYDILEDHESKNHTRTRKHKKTIWLFPKIMVPPNHPF